MSDQFAIWGKLLKLAKEHKTKAGYRAAIVGSSISILETEPHSGYYRSAKEKDGPLLPVAIWRDGDGKLNVLRGDEEVPLERVWPYCVWNPVSYEAYEVAADGKPWPDDGTVTLIEEKPKPAEEAKNAQAEALLNAVAEKPAEDDEATKLAKKIDAAIAAAKAEYAEITSDEQANKAQSARSDLTRLAGQADKTREALVRPHINAQREINDKWNPLVKAGRGMAETIRLALGAYARKKEAEAEAAAAAASQSEPEEQGAPPSDDTPPFLGEQVGGNHPPQEQAPPPPPPPPKAEPIAFKGATGRSAKVVERKTAHITDLDALFAHVKAFPDVKVTLQKIAQRLVDQGQDVPGVEVHVEKDVA